MKRTYLDWASTSPMDPAVLDTYIDAQKHIYGNPSSIHAEGKLAEKSLESSRRTLSACLDVTPENIIFTSGGSESNSLVLLSLLRKKRRGRVLISAIEHPSIYEYAALLREAGFDVREIPADAGGFIRPEEVERLLSTDTLLVSVMTVNNETGALQPVKRIAQRIRKFEKQHSLHIHFHTDAVQAFGKIDLFPADMMVDSASFSAHKLSGPKGTGMLYTASPLQSPFAGGGQEAGYRPGTENVPSLEAFSMAAEKRCASLTETLEHVGKLKRHILEGIKNIDSIEPVPAGLAVEYNEEDYSPYILTFTAAPLPGEVLVRVLDDRGFAVSTGSACSSKRRKKRGRVLRAMGVSDAEAAGAVRVSFGWSTTEEEAESFCSTLERELPVLLKTVRPRK
ncbi:MAG: cysteine desulfurase family protein [Spirochaetaceae bacterium]